MEIGQRFNTLTLELFYINNYKKSADFNTLGLYRSIIDNDDLQIRTKLKLGIMPIKLLKRLLTSCN